MITVTKLIKKYHSDNRPTIDSLTIRLPDSGIVTVIGKSGSGKSTFLRMIGAVDLDFDGSIVIDGINIKKCSAQELADLRLKKIGYSFQDDEFDLTLTVSDALKWPLEVVDMTNAERKALIVSTLKLVGLESKRNSKIKDLSGGEKKRIGIARAIILNPPIILLDEPLSSIDQNNRKLMIDLFKTLSKKSLLVVVTHTPETIATASVLQCVDGRFDFIVDRRNFDHRINDWQRVQRTAFSFPSIIKRGLRTLIGHRTRALLSYSSLIVGLISFGFSFVISDGVKHQVIETLQGSMIKNTLTVSKEQKIAQDDMLRGTELSISRAICKRLPSAKGYGMAYIANFEDMFNTRNAVYLKKDNRILNMNYLSVRHFVNPLREFDIDWVWNDDIAANDVVLVLKRTEKRVLESFLNTEDVNEYVKYRHLTVTLDLAQAEMEYEIECLFNVIGVVEKEQNGILVNDASWNIKFVEEELRLSALNSIELDPVKPWEIRKSSFLHIAISDFLLFYDHFSSRNEFMNLKIQKIEPERYLIISDVTANLTGFEIYDIYNRLKGVAHNYSLSSGVFGYAADGRYNGFMKPVFFSSEREKLNKLADANYSSSVNLEAFQSSSFEIPEGVYISDLISSLKGNGIGFWGYTDPPSLVQGVIPMKVDEILVSDTFYQELFHNSFEKSTSLQVTVLKDTTFVGDSFRNSFVDLNLTITGTVRDDRLLFSQLASFPLSFMISQVGVTAELTKVYGGMIELVDQYDHTEVMTVLNSHYPDLEFSFPSEELEKGVDEATEMISFALLIFSSFSTLIAISLLCLVVFLFVYEDRKSIGIYLVHGYLLNDITHYYTGLIATVVFCALLSSSTVILFLNFSTGIVFSDLVLALKPFIFMFMLSSIILMSVVILVKLKLRRITVMEAFRR